MKQEIKKFDIQQSKQFISKYFDEKVVPSLCQFISIPNLSRNYDPEWYTNGLLEKAATHIKNWITQLKIQGFHTEIIKHQGYSPILYTQVKGDIQNQTIFFYGHFDKQPPMVGWHQGKGPTIPVIENDRLYGRGGADDGYSTYSSMLALKSLQSQGIPLPRCVMITEGDQESGGHIDHYIETLKQRIGNPSVIFCLDSGAIDYDRLWLTNSLRGYIGGVLTISTLTEGVHSGDSSGTVPSCFRILNMIIDRLQDPKTGKISNEKFCVNVPPNRYDEINKILEFISPSSLKDSMPLLENVTTISDNQLQLILNRTWRPQLSITGISNLPPAHLAGNVMIPQIKAKFSLRIPPTLNHETAAKDLHHLLTHDPPFGAKVTFDNIGSGGGWNAPTYQKWLMEAIDESSKIYFQRQKGAFGEGGSIPFMGLLSAAWPKAQFLVTGVLGPQSNAHGPNQFIHLPYTKKLTQAMAYIVAQASRNALSK